MLYKFILASIITALNTSPYNVNVLDEHDRVIHIAKTFQHAIEHNADLIKFTGPAKYEATATLMVATAFRESGFQKSVQHCIKKGDGGKSITLFQMMKPWALSVRAQNKHGYYYWKKKYTEKDMCNNLTLQTQQFMYLHSYIQSISTRYVPAKWFALYCTGKPKQIKFTNNACWQWSRLSQRMKLSGTYCEKNASITFAKDYENNIKNVLKKYKNYQN